MAGTADVTYSVGADFSGADKATEDFAARAEEKLGSIADTLKSAISFEAIGSAGEFFDAWSESANEAVEATRKVQGQLGLMGDDLKRLRGQADDLFLQGVGENVGEAIAAIGSAKQQLGGVLNDQGLAEFTKGAAGVAKVFDTELPEVISKSRTLIQNFGLDGKEAADLVALGMQKAANADGDFLDTLSEYSPLMKKAGLSAQEFTGILTRGVQAGARNTDVLADSIKEAGIRLSAGDISTALKDISGPVSNAVQEIVKAGEAGTITTAQVIQQASSAIGKAFDAGEISDSMRSKLQIAVAGTPAEEIGADLYQRIFSAPVDSSAITAEATKAGEQIGAALGPKTVFESLTKNFELVKSKVAEFAAPVISGLGGVLSTVGQLGPGIKVFSDNFGKIKDLVGGLGGSLTSLATGPIGITIAVIGALVTAFILLYDNVKPFRDFIDNLVSAVGQVFDTVQPALSAFGDLLLTIGGVVLDALVAPFEVAWDVITAIADAIFGATGPSVDFSEVIKAVGAVVEKLVIGFNAMRDGIKRAGDVIQGTKAAFLSFIGSAKDAVGDLLSLDIGGFIDKISSAGDRAAAAQNEAIAKARLDRVKGDVQAQFDASLATVAKGFDDMVAGVKAGTITLEKATKDAQGFLTGFQASNNQQGAELAQKALDQLKGIVQTKVNKNPLTVATKVTPPKPAEIVSFLDDVQKLLEESTALQVKIVMTSTTDATERLRLEFAERERLLERDVENERAALEKKAADAIASKKQLSKAESETLEAALLQLDKKERLLREQLQQDQLAAVRELAQKRVEEENAAAVEGTNRAITVLKAQQAAITGETIGAIRERGELAREELDRQQFLELEQTLQGLEATRRAIGEEGILSGILTRDEVEADLRQFRASLLAHNTLVKAILTRQKNDREALSDAATDKEVQNLRDNDIAWITSTALRTKAVEAFGAAFDTEVLGKLQDERDELLASQNDVWQDYLDGRIESYSDFRDQFGDISQQIADKDAEIQNSSIDGWAAAAIGLGTAFAAVQDQFNTKLNETQGKQFAAFETAVAFQGDTTTEGVAAASKALADMEDLATTAYANTATAYGAGLAAMLDDNKVTLREFLVVSLKALQSLVPVFIVQIFGKQLAELGLLGLVSAGVGTAILQGLLGAAANAIANFETGGFPSGRNTLVRVNERGPEFIADHLSTARNRDAYEWQRRNPGADLALYFDAVRDVKSGPSQQEMANMVMASEMRTRRAMNAEFGNLRTEVQGLRGDIKQALERPVNIEVAAETAVKSTHTHRFNGPNIVETVTTTQRDAWEGR